MGKHWDPDDRVKYDAFDQAAFDEIKARANALAYNNDLHQREAAMDALKLCDMIDALTKKDRPTISPDIMADALQDKVHKDIGVSRPAKSFKHRK